MKRNAFTLVELLVVITIIALLAGLAVPAIGGALNSAKQTADAVNCRQLGIIFFTIANDEGGVYPVNGYGAGTTRSTTPAGTSTDLFEVMIQEGDIKEAKILATNGKTAYKGAMDNTAALLPANVGWDYVAGLNSSDAGSIPLFVSTGAVTDTSGLEGSGTFDLTTTGVWKDQGMVVYTVGNSAEFLKARNGKVNYPVQSTGVIPTAASLLKVE